MSQSESGNERNGNNNENNNNNDEVERRQRPTNTKQEENGAGKDQKVETNECTGKQHDAVTTKVTTMGFTDGIEEEEREGAETSDELIVDNNNKQKTTTAADSAPMDSRPDGPASSVAPTEDVESQATTTNVDESGDSESGAVGATEGGHNEPGKMFVGGLSWQTSAEGLRDYFCRFGEVNECMVMRDPTTKRARGFGFITFADPTAVEKVLAIEIHELDSKRIDPKIAFPKKQQPKMVVKTKKVFIGGLSANSTLDDIKNYFSQYGHIEDAMLMFDKSTQRHRGFGFITFDDDEVSDKVCEIHFHEINGKMVECKKAQPKEVMLPLQLNKTRAAAARNLYGLAPEQLLAYASYIPRLPANAYGPTPMSTAAAQHHGMLATGYSTGHASAAIPSQGVQATAFPGNGFPVASHSHHHHQHQPNTASAPGHGQFTAISGIPSSLRNAINNNGGLNPRDLAAAQLVAQQQAVYEAAMVYANQLSTLAASASVDFSSAAAVAAHHHHHHHPQQQQHPIAVAQHQQPTPLQFPSSIVSNQQHITSAFHSASPAQSAQSSQAQSAQFAKQQ